MKRTIDEIALNKKRGRAQSVEPAPLEELDSEVRFTVSGNPVGSHLHQKLTHLIYIFIA